MKIPKTIEDMLDYCLPKDGPIDAGHSSDKFTINGRFVPDDLLRDRFCFEGYEKFSDNEIKWLIACYTCDDNQPAKMQGLEFLNSKLKSDHDDYGFCGAPKGLFEKE